MSGSVMGLVTHSYHDSFWWELEGGGVGGGGGWGHYPGAHRASLKGCKVLWDSRLSRLYLLAPRQPPMWLSCSVENAALKESPLSRRRGQRPAQRARFVWVLSLTTRAAPHLNLMDPTYAVITMPTSCQLWCGEAFVLQRDASGSCWSVSVYNKSPPQRSHQSKCFSSSLRSFDWEG